MAGAEPDPKTVELTAIIREIQDRVRSRYPQGQAGSLPVPLPDLLPILHARDRAEAKVAAIGSVNPRAGGLVNAVIQTVKRTIARGLNWFIRDQVEFNRASVVCTEETLAALNDFNRLLTALAVRIDEVHREIQPLRERMESLRAEILERVDRTGDELRTEARELKDIREFWPQWRAEQERKVSVNEVQFLRGLADLQADYHRQTLQMEANFRDNIRNQHRDFEGAMAKQMLDVQQRLWADLDKIRNEYEAIIHYELRVVRQRAAALPPSPSSTPPAAGPAPPAFDYLKFAQKFRGPEDWVRNNQQSYVPLLAGRQRVLDLGCGRGEFLDVMKAAAIPARGIDMDEESVRLCRTKGHDAETADLFTYLESQPNSAFDALFASQVMEHLPPERLAEFFTLAAHKLERNGRLILETPNPECLAIFATHFYLDPTHTRPIPPMLLAFYAEEAGFGRIEIRRISPAAESIPAVNDLPESVREQFFGGMDYALIATRL